MAGATSTRASTPSEQLITPSAAAAPPMLCPMSTRLGHAADGAAGLGPPAAKESPVQSSALPVLSTLPALALFCTGCERSCSFCCGGRAAAGLLDVVLAAECDTAAACCAALSSASRMLRAVSPLKWRV